LENNFTIAGGSMAPEDTLRQQERERKRRDWNTHITSWQTSRLSQSRILPAA